MHRGLAALFLLCAATISAAPPPALMLWAWERPGDLRSLPPSAGVAFLAASIYLNDGAIRTVPRFQPLRLAPQTHRMAVVRFETPPTPQPFSAQQRHAAAQAVLDTIRATHPNALQLDFDARASERSFYAALIRELRPQLDPNLFFSITALVSWCDSPSWIDHLPVDEVVPMAFEMGSATAATETFLGSGAEFRNPLCRSSLGISLRESPTRTPAHRRTYVFSYNDWTSQLARSVVTRFQ